MSKVKVIIHERFNGNQSLEDLFLSAFQSESFQLLQGKTLGIIDSTEQSQDPFDSGKELKNGTEAVPENIEEIVAGDHSYIIALYVTRAYRIGLIHFLGNYLVPDKYSFPQYMLNFHENKGGIFRINVMNVNNLFEDYRYDVGSMKELPEKFQDVKLLSSFLHPAWLFYLFDIGFDLSAPVGFYPGLAGKAAMDKLKIYEDMVNTAVEEERRKKQKRNECHGRDQCNCKYL